MPARWATWTAIVLIDWLVKRPQAGLEPGEVDERLERGAGLTLRLGRPVELAFVIIAAADHGAHRSVRRHCDERTLPHRHFAALPGDDFGNRGLCFGLHSGI